jgi:glutamine amidotransferase
MRTVALIDYGSGNLPSAEKALWAAARQLGKHRDIRATADPDFVARADSIVLPGVGAFRACMDALISRDGLVEAMTEAVRTRSAPFLGVCVGMQLLADRGLEFGETTGLGWIGGEVRRLSPDNSHAPDRHHAKVPHMGWNNIEPASEHALLKGMAHGEHMYFTHSFAFYTSAPEDTVANVDHGGRFAAMVARDNVAGVQFHPEKSQAAGLALIQRFLEWRP